MVDHNERTLLGAEKVGTPVNEIRGAIARLASMEQYQQIRYDLVDFYCDRFLCRELISLIDESWSVEQLAAANADVIKVAFIMLLRDMMQAHRRDIVLDAGKQKWDTQWIEQFIVGLLYESQAPMQPYQDWLSTVEPPRQEDSAMLLTGLAKQLCLDPGTLFEYQMAAREVVGEQLPKRPWWRFWS
jgi:hypothetical protein